MPASQPQTRRRAPTRQPWHPAEWEVPDAGALQALARGEAAPEQQRRALMWIIESASGAYEQSFVPDSDRVTAFLEGRRSVGNQIIKLIKINLETLRKANG